MGEWSEGDGTNVAKTTAAVAQSVERTLKGPSLVQLCWREFDSSRNIGAN